MSQPGDLAPRVSALETDMAAVKRQLTEHRKILEDHQRLFEHALPHLQEGIDRVEALVIHENEQTRATTRAALGELRDTLRDQMREALGAQRDEIVALVKSLPTCRGKGQ